MHLVSSCRMSGNLRLLITCNLEEVAHVSAQLRMSDAEAVAAAVAAARSAMDAAQEFMRDHAGLRIQEEMYGL